MFKFQFSAPVPKRLHRSPAAGKSGFTIIELMIATVVFSMILLLISYGVIRFNQAYYGGTVQSQTQTVARAVLENISQAVQFNGGTVDPGIAGTGGWQGLCVGDEQYQYLLGKQLTTSGALGPNQSNHVLLLNANVANCSGQRPGNTLAGTELLGEHMRLSNLVVSQVGSSSLWKIEVRVVYGDDVLLNNPTSTTASCLGGDGSEFCAVSDLTTIVQQRIN